MMVMRDAALAASRLSKDGRSIWITIVEEGFIVQGGQGDRFAAIDIGLAELDMNSGLLLNAVQLIARRLP